MLWLSEERSLNHQRTDYRRKVAVPVCAHSWQCNSHGFFILSHDPIWIGTWSAFWTLTFSHGFPGGLLTFNLSDGDFPGLNFLDIWTTVRGIEWDFFCCDAICTLLFVCGILLFGLFGLDLCLYYLERCDISWLSLSGTPFQMMGVFSDDGLKFLVSICSQQGGKEISYFPSELHSSFTTFDTAEASKYISWQTKYRNNICRLCSMNIGEAIFK